MLRVGVLGELRIERDGIDVPLPASWRAQSLLGWLALHPGTHPRPALAGQFWPDILDGSARASLRNALWSLRRAVGEEALVADRARVSLSGDVQVDAVEFERLLAQGDRAAALALCRGPLLEGLDDDWVLEERDRHRDRVDGVLEALAEDASGNGDALAALEFRRRRVVLDPFGEDAHRALMRHLDVAGDRAGALELYDRFTHRLRTELGTAPSAATRALAAELREQHPEPRPSVAATVPVQGPPVLPRPAFPPRLAADPDVRFVHRNDELARLRAAWDDTTGPRLVLLTGEPGIGKSRLMREFAVTAYGDGTTVVYGLAHSESLVPFEPWAEMLGDELVRRAGQEVPAAVGGRFAELSQSGPVLAVLDDLQSADPSSARLLGHLLRGADRTPRLVVASHRPSEVPEDHPLHAVLANTPHVRIHLEGLSPTELATLVDRENADELHARSAGNPFLALALDQDPDLRLPPAARDVLARRFAALSPGTRRLLEAAAVVGQEFELGVLEPLANLQEEGFLDSLDAGIAAGLVTELPGNVERCTFAHGLVRDALLEAMTAARRRRLHAHAADLVEDPARLAHHLCQAAPLVQPQRIAAAALVAAEQAMAQHAYDEVVEGCTRALAVLPADAASERRPLTLRRAVAFQALSHLVVDIR